MVRLIYRCFGDYRINYFNKTYHDIIKKTSELLHSFFYIYLINKILNDKISFVKKGKPSQSEGFNLNQPKPMKNY